jgi:hypothetical protein
MDSFFNSAWTIADKCGWTDNTLLHALMDVLEREPRSVQERILAHLDPHEA